MIIVGELILAAAMNQMRKTKKEKKKEKDRCSVFMLRDFALVVMVMPCGLTPVEGIDFVDWFYFSMYACAHVRPTQTHTHTHPQTNVQYGAFEEWSLLTEPQQ